MMFVSAGLDCSAAGWGLNQDVPKQLQSEKLKILRVKIFEKSKCKANPVIQKSNEFVCAGVQGKQFHATCEVTFCEQVTNKFCIAKTDRTTIGNLLN